jgi:hypothetical protein
MQTRLEKYGLAGGVPACSTNGMYVCVTRISPPHLGYPRAAAKRAGRGDESRGQVRDS